MRVADDWQPSASVAALRLRAEIVRLIRQWFYQQDILEVETPQLAHGATTDPHIESFALSQRHLRTSAEFHHKRLLAAGFPDIYELGKVFRVDESGRYHNPEFTMLEWYRLGIDHIQLISEVELLLRYLHKDESLAMHCISYRNFWMQHTGIDPATGTCQDIVEFLQQNDVSVPASVALQQDTLQDLAMGTVLAAAMPSEQYTCIYDYPASQASLARIVSNDPDYPVASRFEVYYGSVELANGFHELTDAAEQYSRFEADNRARAGNGQVQRPIDKRFVASLESGMPDCAGVAVGIDRLMMCLIDGVDSMQDIVSFDWQRA